MFTHKPLNCHTLLSVIQSMRVHALYGQEKRMRIFLSCQVLVSLASSAVLFIFFPLRSDGGIIGALHGTHPNQFLGK